ncbi:XrtA/PEP-CTERM system-associated ATPase [uncultured Desulfuromonas sp.]|uniref:XrtA/PEP-CTERM system-associated ATPase n=1 Tax=uncultured Desulfuromonas sp. TaxID=181013 RepID=UPI002AAA9138|nr:XrtA/PEP-CTERM system-associated ATPase [uncultured Desulfuromonas sp.]
MYEAYFGLTTKPFELVPNPQFLFLSHSHRKAINYLSYGLQERAGFILLAGEVGSGKTTIIRNLIKDLDEDIALSRVFNTRADARQVLAMINEDFGLTVENKDKVTLLSELYDYLVELHAAGKRAVIIIDEAQNLSVEVLEEIRLLSNLEADSAKLLQIVLVGQPELLSMITQPELRQLRQRIGIHCHLEPLTRDETEAYVYHRLETAGNREAVVWHDGAFDLLFHYSGGVPRLINLFCDFALLCAFAEESRDLTLELLHEVIGDITWDQQERSSATVQLRELQVRTGGTDSPEQRLTALENLWGEGGEMVRRLEARDERLQQIQLESMRRMEMLLERISDRLGALLVAGKGRRGQ